MSVDATQPLAFTLNGSAVSVQVDPMMRTSALLRDELGMTGTKVGCDAGDCGACTVRLDGEALCACLLPAARLAGRQLETVEHLARDGRLSQLQQSFLDRGAAQCGICTPGMLMAAAQLLETAGKPSAEQVKAALGGVLCRCTGYQKIVEAVVAAPNYQPQAQAPGPAVGSRIARLDGAAKVDGSELFGADASPADALTLRVVRSPHHHASFAFGDLEHFIAQNPGLTAIFTAADIPGNNRHGVIPAFADQPVLAQDIARYRGEAVALLAGEAATLDQLDDADLPLHWEPLPAALDITQALATEAAQLHADRPLNTLTRGLVTRGDTETHLATAAIQAKGTFTTPFVEHAYIEPEAGFARRVGNTLEIHCCTQAPYMDRDDVAQIMGLEPQQVRIVPTAVGGGFGSKLDLSVQPFLALAAWRLQQPVKLTYSRAESMASTTKRHPAEIQVHAGASADGKITALHFTGSFNTGAYASWGPTVANRVPVHASGPYFIPHLHASSQAVHSHTAPAGAFRGFGVPQSAIALECVLDQLALNLGMDRLEFRLHNALRAGQPTGTGQVFTQGVGIADCLEALREPWQQAQARCAEFNTGEPGTKRRGVGLASCWYGCGNTSLPNPSTMRVGLKADGRLVLHQSAVDIGQGANTVIPSICADALGLPVQQFHLVGADTALSPDGGKTSASRQTYVSGKAAMLAGQRLREAILRTADMPQDSELSLQNDALEIRGGGRHCALALDTLPADEDGFVLRAEATYDPPTTPLDDRGQGIPYAVFGYGAQLVELEVDEALGKVRLLKLVAAHDVGKAINRTLVEGQIQGGCAQGIGLALMEEYLPGRSDNLHDYLIPTVGDMPDIECLIIEDADHEGPFGAKGLGEHVLIPTAPAILNAIRHASGVLVTNLPATPDKVRAAIVARDLQRGETP